MKTSLLLFVAVLAASAVSAADDRVVGDFSIASDSDHQEERAADAGYERRLPSAGHDAFVGMRVGHLQISDDQLKSKFTTFKLESALDVSPAVRASVQLRQLFGTWSPTLGSGALSYGLSPRWRIEISGDHDLVDTAIATSQRTRVTTLNLNGDFALTPQVTLTGGVLEQLFSDHNKRTGGLLRAVWSPVAWPGFNVQTRLRRLDADFRGVGYFSPERFEEALLILQYGHAVLGDRFILTAVAGGGAQRINGNDTSAIYRGELRSRGWFSPHFGAEAHVGCTNTGGLQVQTRVNGYRYCYATTSLIGAW